MHAVNTRDRHGDLHRFVLRRHTLTDWLAREPDLAVREGFALELLTDTSVMAPLIIALDPDGSEAGLPSVLMSRLPGRLCVDAPVSHAYLTQLAEALPTIHRVQPPLAFTKLQRYSPYNDLATLGPPPGPRSPPPGNWLSTRRAARGRPRRGPSFIATTTRATRYGDVTGSRGSSTG